MQTERPTTSGIFPRKQRLHGRDTFISSRKQGKRRYLKLLGIIYKQTDLPVRVGFVVGKHVGKAVERNRMRRLLREYLRLHWLDLPIHGNLLWIVQKPFQNSSEALILEINKLIQWVNEPNRQ